MLCRISRGFGSLILAFTLLANLVAAGESPPPPDTPLPAVPEAPVQFLNGLLSSDAFAQGNNPAALPESQPLLQIRPASPENGSPTNVIVTPGSPYTPIKDVIITAGSPYTPIKDVTPRTTAEPSPIEHLRKAADHLDAAGLPEEAEHLRERASDMQRHTRQRLEKLRQQKQRIEQEIEQLEQTAGLSEQVLIQVTMLEVDQQKLKQLGISFETPDGQQQSLEVGPAACFELLSDSRRPAFLQALREESGIVKVLAEPTIVTTFGRPASLVSGGEFPIPQPQPNGSSKLHWEKFGVSIEALPQRLDDGRLRLDLSTEVNERDYRNAELVEGERVPGITTRRINTQVEMRFDQTIVLGGLGEVTHSAKRRKNRAMLDKIPHQERLFKQASDTQSREPARSLFVIMTVKPVRAGAQDSGHTTTD